MDFKVQQFFSFLSALEESLIVVHSLLEKLLLLDLVCIKQFPHIPEDIRIFPEQPPARGQVMGPLETFLTS